MTDPLGSSAQAAPAPDLHRNRLFVIPPASPAMSFDNVPSNATLTCEPFEVSVPQQKLDDLATLLRLCPLAPLNHENAQEETYGVSRKWMEEALKFWKEDFDWYVPMFARQGGKRPRDGRGCGACGLVDMKDTFPSFCRRAQEKVRASRRQTTQPKAHPEQRQIEPKLMFPPMRFPSYLFST
jgi:hypothetical protein